MATRFEPSTKPLASPATLPVWWLQELRAAAAHAGGSPEQLEACRGLMGPPQRAPKTRVTALRWQARGLCETTCGGRRRRRWWKQRRTPPCPAGPRPEAQASGCMAMGRPRPSGRSEDAIAVFHAGEVVRRRHRAGRAAREHQWAEATCSAP